MNYVSVDDLLDQAKKTGSYFAVKSIIASTPRADVIENKYYNQLRAESTQILEELYQCQEFAEIIADSVKALLKRLSEREVKSDGSVAPVANQ